MNLQGCEKERKWTNPNAYPNTWLEEIRRNSKILTRHY